MKIHEVAKLTGVTVRTLHYYDEIGLLKPAETTISGYRNYSESDLVILQQILFFKELDFSLNEIKEIINDTQYDSTEALKRQKELLRQKKERLEGLIELLNQTLKGEHDMSFQQFDMTSIEANKKKYADEIKERWGNTNAYKENEKKTAGYGKGDWEELNEKGTELLKEFGKKCTLLPESEEAQELVVRWQSYITEYFYPCSKEILIGLGQMYIADERFKNNIDKNGTGTAAFMAASIAVYCNQ